MTERETLLCRSCGGPTGRQSVVCQYCGASFAGAPGRSQMVYALLPDGPPGRAAAEFLATIHNQYPSRTVIEYFRTPPALLQIAEDPDRLESVRQAILEAAVTRGLSVPLIVREWLDRIPYENPTVNAMLADQLDPEKIRNRLQAPSPRKRVAYLLAAAVLLVFLSALVPWCLQNEQARQAEIERTRMLRLLHPQPAAWLDALHPLLLENAPGWGLPGRPWRLDPHPEIRIENAEPLEKLSLRFLYTGPLAGIDATKYSLETICFKMGVGFSTNRFRQLVAALGKTPLAGEIRSQDDGNSLWLEHPRCRIIFEARRDHLAVYEQLLDRRLPTPPIEGFDILVHFPVPGKMLAYPQLPPERQPADPPDGIREASADDPALRHLLGLFIRTLAAELAGPP